MTGPEKAQRDATLSFSGTAIDLPVEQPVMGRTALDVSSLSNYGLSVYDPGYADTAAYQSAITFVDGEAGRLYYRGYPVEQLATSYSFLDVAYLLIYGELPTAEQADKFVGSVRDRKLALHVGLERLFDSFPQSMHPMAMLAIATEAMSAYAEDAANSGSRQKVEQAGIKLLSAMPIFAGYALSTLRGLTTGQEQPFSRLRRRPASAMFHHPRERLPAGQRHGQGARHPPRPPRRPRAQLLDRHFAAGGLFRGRVLRRGVRSHKCALARSTEARPKRS